jgi:hypothetical protein
MKRGIVVSIGAVLLFAGCNWFRPKNEAAVSSIEKADTIAQTKDRKKDNTMVVYDSTRNAGKRI